MGLIKFWSGMNPRPASSLRGDDKILVGLQNQEGPEHSDLGELKKWLKRTQLRKDGYRWEKAEGKTNENQYELGDEIQGAGTLFPGYWIHGYINTEPMTNMNEHITIINSVKI